MSKGWKRRKTGRVVKKVLADGTIKEYHYAPYKKAPSRVPADSVEALIRSYKRSPNWAELAQNTKDGYTTYLKPFEDAFATASVKTITRREIITVRDGIAKTRGKGAATGFTRAVSALFTWAVENDQIERSPVHKIKRLEGGHLPAWTVEQAQIALMGLPEHFRRAVVLGVYTGQRRGDLCSVKWSAYDGERIKFVQEKTGEVVVATVTPHLKAELDAWMAESASDTILTDAKGRRWNPNKLSVTLPQALADLGLPKGLNIHGLRKLFAATLADRGGTVHQIAASTGHKTLSMVQLYTRSANQPKLAAEASLLLPDFSEKTGAKNQNTTSTTDS